MHGQFDGGLVEQISAGIAIKIQDDHFVVFVQSGGKEGKVITSDGQKVFRGKVRLFSQGFEKVQTQL